MLLKLKSLGKRSPLLLLITPTLIRGHIAGYGDVSFIVQHLSPPCNQTGLTCPFTRWVCFQPRGTSWTRTRTPFPSLDTGPSFGHRLSITLTQWAQAEITQCGTTGSQDKVSSSASSLPASREKTGHRSGQIQALARPALTWRCLKLP